MEQTAKSGKQKRAPGGGKAAKYPGRSDAFDLCLRTFEMQQEQRKT